MQRPTGRDNQWGNGVAMAIAAAVVLLLFGLLVMDMHLSYKHVYFVNHELNANDKYVQNGGSQNIRLGLDMLSTFSVPNNISTLLQQSSRFVESALEEMPVLRLSPDASSTETPEKVPKIAYIFAGSARSFVCPQVHWSIKSNLIDALGGEPHSFVRMSLEDNKNVKTGTGIIFKPQFDEREINETLKILNPDIVERFSYSDQVADMMRLHPQEIHTVFRENDQRRYSMFFHRCEAYKLMLRYEKEHNVRFDWVVLGRVDAGWIEPILPINAYDNDRVWITETGYDRFNDQFMLIPRQFSDYLYDLDTKVKKGVYCLGGPDVEQWKCNTTELRNRGVSEEKIQSVLPYCCPDILNKQTNHIGRSERIHYKHLETGKIPLGIGRFPTFLTRRMPNGECVGECFRIYAYHYKEYVFRFSAAIYPYLMPPIWPDTRGRSISARDRNLCYILKEPVYPWKPITVTALHDSISGHVESINPLHETMVKNGLIKAPAKTDYHIDYSKKLTDPSQHLHPSIIQNPKDTELWRVHPTWNTEGCLTFSYKDKTVAWEPCRGHCMAKSISYMPNQLFFIYVVPQKPPALKFIKNPSYHAPNWFPESTYNTPVSNITRLMMLNSEPTNLDYRTKAYCLTATKLALKAKIVFAECTQKVNDPMQSLLTVRAESDGSHPQSTNGQMRFAAAPELCVCRTDNKPVEYALFPETDELYVYSCDWKAHFHKNLFEFELIGS